jgi:protoheme IX farnesyltransferase
MSITVAAAPTVAAGLKRRLADYIVLTKPRITLMALVTVAVGGFSASSGPVDLVLLAHALFGTASLAAGASVLNQVMERDTDAKMRRTADRPLPAGRVQITEGLAFGGALSVFGMGYLTALVNPLTGLLGAATLAIYVFVYTPLKRVTSFNTLVGAVPGALPPVMGWAAMRGSLGVEAWTLFLIVFLWQFPHFLAIAWIYRDDYARAGLKMLPVFDLAGAMTGRQMILHSLVLLPASLAPTVVGLTGPGYFVGALLLGIVFLGFSVGFWWFVSTASARNLMRASLIYLPALLALLIWDLSL